MKRSLVLFLAALLALACLAVPAAAQAPALPGGQDKPADLKKLLAEIVGEYEFALPGRSVIVRFTEREGKLYGAPPDEAEELISPVEGKPLCFDLTVGDSADYYVLQFARNDQGVIDTCVITLFGMTLEGKKIKSPAAAAPSS